MKNIIIIICERVFSLPAILGGILSFLVLFFAAGEFLSIMWIWLLLEIVVIGGGLYLLMELLDYIFCSSSIDLIIMILGFFLCLALNCFIYHRITGEGVGLMGSIIFATFLSTTPLVIENWVNVQ